MFLHDFYSLRILFTSPDFKEKIPSTLLPIYFSFWSRHVHQYHHWTCWHVQLITVLSSWALKREIKEYANMWLFFSCVLKSTEFYYLSSIGISHHLQCSPRILCKQCKLLHLNQCDQFITIVCGYFISDEHRSAMMGLLMPPIYSVIHSLHKSTVTYVTHGKTSSPSIVFTCIRTNCTMPGVMSRYICYEAKGDLCQ